MAVCYIVGAGDCPPLDNIRINEAIRSLPPTRGCVTCVRRV